MKTNYSVLFLCILLSCQADDEMVAGESYWEAFRPFTTDYNARSLEKTSVFSARAVSMGEVELEEASGLAWSRRNSGFLWTQQDSGNDNRLFLLDSKSGQTVAAYRIQGTDNRDWEDIEIGPGPMDEHPYLYVGDIGDNEAIYGTYTIYRFEEPLFEESHRGETIELEVGLEKITYHYPEQEHDVESLMVDPLTKDIYIVTKRDARSVLYVAPYPQPLNAAFSILKGGIFPFWAATAATVSEDGREIMIRTYDQIFYWQRQHDEPLVETLSRAPREAPYNPVEAQGEAICFDDKGGYFTLSEFRNEVRPVLYYYARE